MARVNLATRTARTAPADVATCTPSGRWTGTSLSPTPPAGLEDARPGRALRAPLGCRARRCGAEIPASGGTLAGRGRMRRLETIFGPASDQLHHWLALFALARGRILVRSGSDGDGSAVRLRDRVPGKRRGCTLAGGAHPFAPSSSTSSPGPRQADNRLGTGAPRARGDADRLCLEGDDVPLAHLRPRAGVDLTVDGDQAAFDDLAGRGAVVDDTGELEQLAEPDGVVRIGTSRGVLTTSGYAARVRGRVSSLLGRPGRSPPRPAVTTLSLLDGPCCDPDRLLAPRACGGARARRAPGQDAM